MTQKLILIGLLVITPLVFINYQQQKNFPTLKDEYLGQKPPGLAPEVFASSVISTGMDELNSIFSPDGKIFFFTSYKKSQKIFLKSLTL